MKIQQLNPLQDLANERRLYAAQHPFTPGMDIRPYRMRLARGLVIEFRLDVLTKGERFNWVLALARQNAVPSPVEIGIMRRVFAVPDKTETVYDKRTTPGRKTIAFVKMTWGATMDRATNQDQGHAATNVVSGANG